MERDVDPTIFRRWLDLTLQQRQTLFVIIGAFGVLGALFLTWRPAISELLWNQPVAVEPGRRVDVTDSGEPDTSDVLGRFASFGQGTPAESVAGQEDTIPSPGPGPAPTRKASSAGARTAAGGDPAGPTTVNPSSTSGPSDPGATSTTVVTSTTRPGLSTTTEPGPTTTIAPTTVHTTTTSSVTQPPTSQGTTTTTTKPVTSPSPSITIVPPVAVG